RGLSLNALIGAVDAERRSNLSSALRLFIRDCYRRRGPGPGARRGPGVRTLRAVEPPRTTAPPRGTTSRPETQRRRRVALRGRRLVLRGAGCTALAAAAGFTTRAARAQQAAPYSAGTEAPKLKAPAGASDCHMHIYDSRFPVAPTATLRPPDAHVDDYRLLQQRIGTERNVIVTPSTYGTDNRC